MLGARGVAHVVGHPVEHRGEHRLEHHAGHVGADAAVDAEPEAEVPVAGTVQVDLVRVGEDRGSRLAIAHDSQSRSPSLNCWPAISQSAEMVRPSPGAGVKKRRNSSVAGSSSVSRSRPSRSRWSGCSDSHSRACAVSAVVVSNPPPMSSPSIPSSSKSGGGLAVDLQPWPARRSGPGAGSP